MINRTTLIILALSFFYVSSAQALSWNKYFVVWDGKVYEIKESEGVDPSEIGKYIGKVESKADDNTGKYKGNGSNIYPVGTKYYKLNNISSDTAIAVEVDNNQWRKAEFIHEAPFYYTDLFGDFLPYTLLVVFMAIIFVKAMTGKRN